MKRIMALVVLALFVCSTIPAVLSDESKNTTKEQPQKAKVQEIKNQREDIKKSGVERRGIISDAKEQKKELRSANAELKIQLREKIKSCRNDSSQCKELKSQMKANVKERLIISADEMIVMMENLKEKIQSLNPSNKDELIAAVDADIAKVQGIKAKLEALPDDAKASEVNVIAKELKDIWKEARKGVKINGIRMLALGFENVLAKAERLETQLNSAIEKLKARGYDTTVVSAKVEDFKAKVQASKAYYEEAKAMLVDLQTSKDTDTTVKAIQEKMKLARDQLQSAQSTLRDILKEIKSQKDGSKVLEEEIKTE